MDIFQRCIAFYSDPAYAKTMGYPTNPRTAQALGLYPFFIPIDQSEGTEVIIDGRRLIMLGSNNYLGLTTHPQVRSAAASAVQKYGTGFTGSRFLNGTSPLHIELENRLALFVGKEKALVFGTGYQANLGTISSLLGNDDVVICDKKSHASIIDGVGLLLSRTSAQARYFRHNDMASLKRILASYPRDQGKLVVVDGVFSMTGDIAPLPEIVELCKGYGARLMVDDAHALGVLGNGRGTGFHFGCIEGIDIVMGTFSKSFASLGGFVAGPAEVIHWIQHFARSLTFSASLPPANAAAVLSGLDVIHNEPERVERVNMISEMIRHELGAMGYDIGTSETPIVPIILGDQFRTMQTWRELYDLGIYVNVALPPAVPSSQALLRTSYMATHTDEQLERVLGIFAALRTKSARPLKRKRRSAVGQADVGRL